MVGGAGGPGSGRTRATFPRVTLVAELRRRGVFGALIAYGVAAAGLLQLLELVQ